MCTASGRRGYIFLWQHRTIPALRLKHRSGSCGTASALPKCSIRHPVLSAALTFAASSIICAFGLASAAPRSPYRHLELCGIALSILTQAASLHFLRIMSKIVNEAKIGHLRSGLLPLLPDIHCLHRRKFSAWPSRLSCSEDAAG